ncbi:MAG: hypothetical protein H0X33_12740 [Taibaiella sp.]|nr:hypothetical protein [Taibaiella sp.]
MKDLLSVEWLKIKSYRTFWILIGCFIVLLPLWNYEISKGIINFTKGAGANLLGGAYSFPGVWGNVGFWGSVFVLFLSMLIIIITTNEFTFRTHRQNVIDGWSRLQFYHAKVLMVVLFSVLATIYYIIIGACFGMSNLGTFGDIFSAPEQFGYFFLISLDYMGFAMLLALLLRRSGLSMGLFLVYTIILEAILQHSLNYITSSKAGNYLPLQASDELLPFPLTEMMRNMMHAQQSSLSSYVYVTIGWCLVYYFAGRMMMLKRDW